jgi:hypothetical protein
MKNDLESVRGVDGDVLHIAELSLGTRGRGIELTPDGRHGGDGYAVLDANGAAELVRVLSTWLAKPVGAHPIAFTTNDEDERMPSDEERAIRDRSMFARQEPFGPRCSVCGTVFCKTQHPK